MSGWEGSPGAGKMLVCIFMLSMLVHKLMGVIFGKLIKGASVVMAVVDGWFILFRVSKNELMNVELMRIVLFAS